MQPAVLDEQQQQQQLSWSWDNTDEAKDMLNCAIMRIAVSNHVHRSGQPTHLSLVSSPLEEVGSYTVPVVVHGCLKGRQLGGLQQPQACYQAVSLA